MDVINEQIKVRQALIIGPSGEKMGVMSLRDAREYAKKSKMDVVLVKKGEQGEMSVCKIMDYHKMMYQKKKNMKKSAEIETKEIQFNVEIADHDLLTHAKKYSKWISSGKVKVLIRVKMHGRMIDRPEMAMDTLHRFLDLIPQGYIVDKEPKVSGRDVIAYIKNF